jgi:FtsZ-interacting cell division protein ZipA
MNDDYLWDKSGEPDPEIQELEQILAPLRYQPAPLELPNELPTRRRHYFPLLAIAATVLIALLATGVWLKLRTEESIPPQEAKSVPPVPSAPPVNEAVVNNTKPSITPVRRRHKPMFTKDDREAALVAKEQVMLALRVASEKLKLAQRRTQGASPNQIKNQHKVG